MKKEIIDWRVLNQDICNVTDVYETIELGETKVITKDGKRVLSIYVEKTWDGEFGIYTKLMDTNLDIEVGRMLNSFSNEEVEEICTAIDVDVPYVSVEIPMEDSLKTIYAVTYLNDGADGDCSYADTTIFNTPEDAKKMVEDEVSEKMNEWGITEEHVRIKFLDEYGGRSLYFEPYYYEWKIQKFVV